MAERPTPEQLTMIRENVVAVRYLGLARQDVPALLAELRYVSYLHSLAEKRIEALEAELDALEDDG
jgi:hypothetical protein